MQGELKNARGLEQCQQCLRYIRPIQRLHLKTMLTDGTGTTTFVARGIVAESVIGRTAAQLSRIREAKEVQHVFEILYGILHRQMVFQVLSPTYAEKMAGSFEVTNAFVKPKSWAEHFVDDFSSEEPRQNGKMDIQASPPILQMNNMRIACESLGTKQITDEEGAYDKTVKGVHVETSMDDID
ncbi:hypothetical protein MKX01_009929 [Papaver californicum]|nr:hypothetical protein MKX01_009929 [Papaver californicum]